MASPGCPRGRRLRRLITRGLANPVRPFWRNDEEWQRDATRTGDSFLGSVPAAVNSLRQKRKRLGGVDDRVAPRISFITVPPTPTTAKTAPASSNGPAVESERHRKMEHRGGTGATVRRAAAPAQPRPSPSSATNFARTTGATPSEADAQRRDRTSRPCMAFRIDAAHAGVGKTGSVPWLVIPVGRLGRHDATFRYERCAVRVR